MSLYWDFKAKIPRFWPNLSYFSLKIPISKKNKKYQKMADEVFLPSITQQFGRVSPSNMIFDKALVKNVKS